VRAWIASDRGNDESFERRVHAMQLRLAKRLFGHDVRRDSADARRAPAEVPPMPLFAGGDPVEPGGWLWRDKKRPVWLSRPSGRHPFGPREAHALDAELLAHLAREERVDGTTLILVEDSPGHEATADAEALCVSQYLAQHAAVVALLRARGVRVAGVLAGTGHSAAFFVNALQAPNVYALPQARVVAMEPAAIARVTGLDPAELMTLIEEDPALGHPVRHFGAWGGIKRIVPEMDRERLLSLVAEEE